MRFKRRHHPRPARTRRRSRTRGTLALGCALAFAPVTMHAQRSAGMPQGFLAASHASPNRMIARPFVSMSDAALVLRDSLVSLARKQVGRRYVFGGTSPRSGFDCSGLIRYVAAKLDIPLPRTAAEQARIGARVTLDTAALKPGDLLAFGHRSISHIGIYVGNGKMVHASSQAGRVIETRIDRRLGHLPLRVVRRVVDTPPADARWLQ